MKEETFPELSYEDEAFAKELAEKYHLPFDGLCIYFRSIRATLNEDYNDYIKLDVTGFIEETDNYKSCKTLDDKLFDTDSTRYTG